MDRQIQPNSTERGEYGLRSDEEWERLKHGMKRLLYDIISPITGATFTKLSQFVPKGHFEGDYDLVLPEHNIILWRGISYLAGEALIELNVEGSIGVEPCSAMVYQLDEKWNDVMRFDRARGWGLQAQLSWLPLSFWTPEMHKARAGGGMSNKNKHKLIKKYEDEGRERWKGIKLLEEAKLLKMAELRVREQTLFGSMSEEETKALLEPDSNSKESTSKAANLQPISSMSSENPPSDVFSHFQEESNPASTAKELNGPNVPPQAEAPPTTKSLSVVELRERMRRAEKGE